MRGVLVSGVVVFFGTNVVTLCVGWLHSLNGVRTRTHRFLFFWEGDILRVWP